MAEYKQLRVGRLDPKDDKRLENAAVKAGTTKADLARRFIKEGLDREERVPYLKQILDEQKASRAELQSLRSENRRLTEILYAVLASEAWVGKQNLCAEYGCESAKRLSAMLVAMTPAQTCGMFLRMGEHMATTDGDLRRAQAVICDLPGVDVTRMGYQDDDEWRAGFDANGDPIPGYVPPIPKQVEKDFIDLFYEDDE